MSTSKAGLEIKDGIAVLKFDKPPVNSLGLELRQAIVASIEQANADLRLKPSSSSAPARDSPEARISANSARRGLPPNRTS